MPSPLMTVSFALPAACVAPKNMVFAGPAAGAGRSIFAPQLPQNRLSAGISAPQLGQFLTAMAREHTRCPGVRVNSDGNLDRVPKPSRDELRRAKPAYARRDFASNVWDGAGQSERFSDECLDRRGPNDGVLVGPRSLEERDAR